MLSRSTLQDIGVALLIVAGLVVGYFVVVAGLMSIIIIGIATPFWLIILIAFLILRKKRRSQK